MYYFHTFHKHICIQRFINELFAIINCIFLWHNYTWFCVRFPFSTVHLSFKIDKIYFRFITVLWKIIKKNNRYFNTIIINYYYYTRLNKLSKLPIENKYLYKCNQYISEIFKKYLFFNKSKPRAVISSEFTTVNMYCSSSTVLSR